MHLRHREGVLAPAPVPPPPAQVSLGHLKEVFTEAHAGEENGTISLHKAKTDDHKGDVFTKELEVHKYLHALEMMNVTDGRPD